MTQAAQPKEHARSMVTAWLADDMLTTGALIEELEPDEATSGVIVELLWHIREILGVLVTLADRERRPAGPVDDWQARRVGQLWEAIMVGEAER
jgi:hypothetical protein